MSTTAVQMAVTMAVWTDEQMAMHLGAMMAVQMVKTWACLKGSHSADWTAAKKVLRSVYL